LKYEPIAGNFYYYKNKTNREDSNMQDHNKEGKIHTVYALEKGGLSLYRDLLQWALHTYNISLKECVDSVPGKK
jgi:hypothetical protein